nr:capsid protein [Mute swan feces associated chapparvovirus 1]
MVLSKTYKQLRYLYIDNSPMQYPQLDISTQDTFTKNNPRNTGWQVLPNQLIGHMLSPAQWWDITRTFDAMRVDAVKGTVFNMIPLTETLAIQGNTTFTAFNNTIYALGYADNKYETEFFNWTTAYDNFNIYQKEGMESQVTGTSTARMNLPIYHHYLWGHPEAPASWPKGAPPTTRTAYPQMAGVLWDPLNCPEDLMELRPGKNAIQYSWTRRADDTHELYSLNNSVYFSSYRKNSTNPDTMWQLLRAYNQQFNWGMTPLVDNFYYNDVVWSTITKSWTDPSNIEFVKAMNVLPPYGQFNAKWPIPNWFIKLVPLYSAQNTLIQTSAQICYLTEVTVTGEPRQTGAHFAPNIDAGCGGVDIEWGGDVATTMSWNTSVYGTGKSAFYGIPTIIPHSASHRPRFAIDWVTNPFFKPGQTQEAAAASSK